MEDPGSEADSSIRCHGVGAVERKDTKGHGATVQRLVETPAFPKLPSRTMRWRLA
jgi:hypothetical protein